jgi:hypothetical protein
LLREAHAQAAVTINGRPLRLIPNGEQRRSRDIVSIVARGRVRLKRAEHFDYIGA